jgi:hypothetical protein
VRSPWSTVAKTAGWNTPRTVPALPMALLRTQNYPGNPGQIVQGIHQYQQVLAGETTEPIYMPARSTYQRHKLEPETRWPGATAYGALSAVMAPAVGPVATTTGLALSMLPSPYSPAWERAQQMGLVRLPQIGDTIPDHTRQYVIAKQVPRHDRLDYPQAYWQSKSGDQVSLLSRQLQRDQAQSAALQQQAGLQAQFHAIAQGRR